MSSIRSYRVTELAHRHLNQLAKRHNLSIGNMLLWLLQEFDALSADEMLELLQQPEVEEQEP